MTNRHSVFEISNLRFEIHLKFERFQITHMFFKTPDRRD